MLALWTGDARLRGRWRSDRERTLAEWRFPSEASPEQRALVADMFGKLELVYTRWRCHSLFDGARDVAWYQVLAKDEASVMIRSWGRLPHLGRMRSLMHVHFEDDSYWITLGTSNVREFFRRIG